MKKILLIISLLSAFTYSNLVASDKKLDATKLQTIKSTNKVLQQPNLQIESGIDKGDIYFLKVKASSPRGNQIFNTFVDKKTGIVYFGAAYDKDGKQLLFPKDQKIIKEGVAFSYGNGNKEIYLVTDPECPYCTQFEKEAEGKLGDYTVHVIFYPLSFHKKAPAMIEWIMKGKNDAEKRERLVQIVLKNSTTYLSLIKDAKKPFQYTPSTQAIIEKSLKAVQELGVRGTPTTYDGTFNEIPWKKLVTIPKNQESI